MIANSHLYIKKTLAILGLVFLFGLLNGCEAPQNQQPVKAVLYVFGTMVEISVYDENQQHANHAIAQVEEQFRQFHKDWHAWEKGGVIYKINQAIARQQPITVSLSVKEFIEKSIKLSQQSQGLFDPGIGSLISLWGFHSEQWQGPPPSNDKIQAWLTSAPSIADISFTGNQLTSSNPMVQLDFGGNAKGLAIDLAMQTLQENGIQNALVSIGGDMKALGSKYGQAWTIGIQSPKHPSTPLAKIRIKGGESVVTSGDYQRFFEWQGRHYSHIIDPKSGYPADTFSSVTVIHEDATTADSAATAILVAGPQRWLKIAESMHVKQVLCIDHRGQIFQTESMAQRVQFIE